MPVMCLRYLRALSCNVLRIERTRLARSINYRRRSGGSIPALLLGLRFDFGRCLRFFLRGLLNAKEAPLVPCLVQADGGIGEKSR